MDSYQAERIAVALERIADILAARETYEVSRRPASERLEEENVIAQRQVAQAALDAADRQAVLAQEQRVFFEDQRAHMRECARRYEALQAGRIDEDETRPIKH